MATSGSYDFGCTAEQVMTEALEQIHVLEAGETIDSDDRTSLMRTLNMMIKQWSGNFDFAPGLKKFSIKRGVLFLQKNQASYSIGPSGDKGALSYVSTTMRVSGITSDTTLEVTDTTGISAAYIIGIELDSGSIYWTTVTSVTDTDTLVIPASGLTSAAAAGNRIFAYATANALMRPLYIEQAYLRDTDSQDSPISEMTQAQYEGIYDKTETAQPQFYLYENTLSTGTLRIDCYPDDVTKVIRLVFMAPGEDIDSSSNDIAYPQEWLLPLSLGLAKLSAPKFQKSWDDNLESNFQQSLMIARTSYAETCDDYFQPGLE